MKYRQNASVYVVYLYCGLIQRGTQTPESLLRSLLKQLALTEEQSFSTVERLHEVHIDSNAEPSIVSVRETI